VDNLIKLKELQVVSGVFKKGGQRVKFSFLFQKGFFWVKRGRWGNSTPFQKMFFFKGLG
jgi:hypothetical protein